MVAVLVLRQGLDKAPPRGMAKRYVCTTESSSCTLCVYYRVQQLYLLCVLPSAAAVPCVYVVFLFFAPCACVVAEETNSDQVFYRDSF